MGPGYGKQVEDPGLLERAGNFRIYSTPFAQQQGFHNRSLWRKARTLGICKVVFDPLLQSASDDGEYPEERSFFPALKLFHEQWILVKALLWRFWLLRYRSSAEGPKLLVPCESDSFAETLTLSWV